MPRGLATTRLGMLALVSCALTLSAACLLAARMPAAAATAPLPRVTLFGDSIATAISFDAKAREVLGRGIDLQLETAPCRRLAQESCPYNGARPPTVVDLVKVPGEALGDTVIVAVGYNDFEAAYADNIEDVLTALRADHVTRVLWVTLRAERHPYVTMNDAIKTAASKHAELTVVDWNVYSRSHPEWFQSDGLHLNSAGAEAMATLFHDSLVALGIPVAPPAPPSPRPVAVVSSALQAGLVGRKYSVALVARGGTKPYRWRRTLGHIPAGLHLLADGRLAGTPRSAGSYTAIVRVTDARGVSATRRLTLRIRA